MMHHSNKHELQVENAVVVDDERVPDGARLARNYSPTVSTFPSGGGAELMALEIVLVTP